MKLPKDLEAKRDEYSTSEIRKLKFSEFKLGFDAGAQAVLEHEMIKKLEEAIQFFQDARSEEEDDIASLNLMEALAEFRAWKDGK